MKRIDRIISEQTSYSRKEIKKLISKKLVFVDGIIVEKENQKYDENNISIQINGEEISIKERVYLLLNKPKGYVSTTEEENQKTVIDLVPEEYRNRNLFPAGRLDKDTTGLMLITDDGVFAHNILAPKKHVKKEYEVTLDIPVTEEMKREFEKGIVLKDGVCKPAILTITGKNKANVVITEGRYHQIKRMFASFKGTVIDLNRICIGNLYMPLDLELGSIREATELELEKIQCK